MILDKKLSGILDQGIGCLEIFDPPAIDKTLVDLLVAISNISAWFFRYESALGVIANTSKVVESLYTKSQKLFS